MKLTIIDLDDWEGIYADGKLIDQGHSLDLENILNKLGYNIDYHYIENEDLDEFGNSLPDKEEDILNYINKINSLKKGK